MIGVFDSGVGGLSILHSLQNIIPNQPMLFIADQAHVPYGPRPLQEVREFSVAITDFLISQGAEIIVVACNTASAAALNFLREQFPHIPFVGMEPAVKPAAEQTLSGVVGVLATPATFQGPLYTSVVERFASQVRIMQNTCSGLVEQIESGDLQGQKTRKILLDALNPMLDAGIDTVVLGCTHYPFVIPLIQEIVGDQVRVINPAEAVARQAKRLVEKYGILAAQGKSTIPHCYTTSSPDTLQSLAIKLIGKEIPVTALCWNSHSPVVLSICKNRLS
ncbi:MAG: glutamate racemase [Anaerolineaceae bacterium]|nr:glutamate racemase [Anaerolineaceae bacterium]